MLKKVFIICMISIICITALGCKKSSSYTFNVSTGEKIKITLDTSTKYSISQDKGIFYILDQKKNTILEGQFLKTSDFEKYKEALNVQSERVKIYQNDKNILYWSYSPKEFSQINDYHITYIKKISNKTSIITTSTVPKKENDKALKLLTFSIK